MPAPAAAIAVAVAAAPAAAPAPLLRRRDTRLVVPPALAAAVRLLVDE